MRVLHAVTLALLAACGPAGSDSTNARTSPDSAPPPADTTRSVADDPSTPAAIIGEYYDAIAAGDHRRAYLLWGDSGRASGQTFEQFRAGFAHTISVTAHVGEPGRIEGAAGSRYVEVPVRIEAVTTADTIQRFAGSYVLRRAVVEGATATQRRWHIHGADISPCPGACPPAGGAPTGAMDVVRRFGERLRMVSVLAPTDIVVPAIREQYGPLVTPDLLGRWIADPSSAPGRQVSSPWPQRIEITDVRGDGEDVRVLDANVVYVTSADTTRVVDREAVTIEMVRGEDGIWRIADVDD
jgi:hypothetical protein